MEWIDIKLHPELADAARRMARARDITVGQLVRDLLARELRGVGQARPPVRADERLVAPLRARLAGDLAHARNWTDLQDRLENKGYALRAAGGGLALHALPDDQRVCKASELGFSHSRLMRRFGTPFPGHVDTMRAGNRCGVRDITDDFDVIEPF